MIPLHGSQRPARGGHYESWFVRANHPHRPQAFWIRYTQFIPGDGARTPLGELWAIWFDGEANRVIAVKEEVPLHNCSFSRDHMQVRIGDAELHNHYLEGQAARGNNSIGWRLNYEGPDQPLLFLPESLYDKALPRAKSVISRPQVQFSGVLTVNGEKIALDAWPGSENHNWGSRHTDQYAWGQVAAFDNMPDAFLECITARIRIGPLPSPWMSIACLRLGDEDLLFNRLSTAFRAKGSYRFFHWNLATANEHGRLEVEVVAPREHFAALTYYNPPAGSKTCLNSKIASCTARLHRHGRPGLELTSRHGAAFEILTDRDDHGCPLLL